MASRQILRRLSASRFCLGRLPTLATRGSQLYRSNAVCSSSLTRVVASQFHTTSTRFNENIINIQDEDDFKDRVVNNEKPVVIDFHATWCGPCKLLGPRLESIISGKNGKVIMAKVDIDDLQDIAISHGVQAVPTVVAMKNGKIVDHFVGVKDDADVESFVNKLTGE